ncbi:MAG TPA: Mpo1-like protein [Candidatus Saccharimonadia bacterium]|nr:Mpo1-like protein [Candidatus Saccharimonadia bacterium]
MNAVDPAAVVDRRREVDRLLGNYSEDHRHPTNITVHHVCVPLIVWSLVAVLWVVPVAPGVGRPGLWAALAMVGALGFYFRLSRPLGFAAFVMFGVMALVTGWLYRLLGPAGLLWTAIVVFVGAWIGQFVGHRIEGKRPSFLTDLVYLLIGPIWIVAKLLRKLHIAY